MLACFVTSMAFAFSSILKGGMGATIATLLTYMLILPIISGSLAHAGYDTWFMPDRAGDSIAATYNIPLENMFWGVGGLGRGGFSTTLMRASQNPTLSFFVLMVYAIILLLLSIWVTNRKEMI
jgi:ABC-type transport system involved in multi-copper enzyme maturation permease subunit